MAKSTITSIGIDYDAISMRAVKIGITRSGSKLTISILGLHELFGNFATDEPLQEGLKKIKEKIGLTNSDKIVTCLSLKQLYVAQIPFRRLPDLEMKSALRLEIKKNLPFEVAGAHIDYQFVGNKDKKAEPPQIIVTAVASVMLTRHITMMERLGIKPHIVDVLPLAIANAFHVAQPTIALELAYVVVHIGPQVTNLIITGDDNVPFFHRSIYFASCDLFDSQNEQPPDNEDIAAKLVDLTEEISRSIAFYEKTYSLKNFAGLYLLGDYLEHAVLTSAISYKTGLSAEIIDIFARLKQASNAPKGKFEVALALAMRNSL